MKNKIQELHEQGLGTNAIAKQLGVSSPTVVYHKKTLGIAIQKQDRNVDWNEVQALLNSGTSQRMICKKIGIAGQTLYRALELGKVVRPEYSSLDFYIENNTGKKCNNSVLKSKLMGELGWEDKCSECDVSEWRGKPITIQLDHIDGDPTNHSINNLRFLCPNCHSQTETWGNKTRIAPCATG